MAQSRILDVSFCERFLIDNSCEASALFASHSGCFTASLYSSAQRILGGCRARISGRRRDEDGHPVRYPNAHRRGDFRGTADRSYGATDNSSVRADSSVSN